MDRQWKVIGRALPAHLVAENKLIAAGESFSPAKLTRRTAVPGCQGQGEKTRSFRR